MFVFIYVGFMLGLGLTALSCFAWSELNSKAESWKKYPYTCLEGTSFEEWLNKKIERGIGKKTEFLDYPGLTLQRTAFNEWIDKKIEREINEHHWKVNK